MFTTTLKRIIRSGFVGFWRNGFVTLASVLVMTTTLFVLGMFIFLDAMLDGSIEQIREKVDVNVYFAVDAPPSEIERVQSDLEALPEVANVEYISRERAIEEFRNRHENDELIIGALEELEGNPLGAYLNVLANETTDYERIAETLVDEQEEGLIENINYFQNQEAINKLTEIINTIDWMSIVILVFFVLVSILITFNTIRLAIYNSREEISVMKLVGASNTYVRGPFVIEGVMYGIVSALFALVLFYPLSLWLGDTTETFFGSTNMFEYYVDHFAQLFLILVLFGIALGAVSSFLAVKRYLKI
jgi:cell division transport system permease protein